jgi:hypothetical protein
MELLKSMRQSHHSVDSWCDAHGDAWLCWWGGLGFARCSSWAPGGGEGL